MNSQTQWSSIQTPSEPITPERQSSLGLSDPFSQSLSINQMTTMTKKIEDLAEIARQIAHSKEILLQWITSITKEALDLKEQANKIVKEILGRRVANCWKLISNRRIAAAIVDCARRIFNWNCTNLIDIFINFAELQWNAPIIPAGSLDQFGFDLIQRILSADVEQFYLDAISNIRKGEYGLVPNEGNPYRLIVIPFSFQHNLCVPDSCHALEQIDFARDIISGIG